MCGNVKSLETKEIKMCLELIDSKKKAGHFVKKKSGKPGPRDEQRYFPTESGNVDTYGLVMWPCADTCLCLTPRWCANGLKRMHYISVNIIV